jgi:hypothetical protein
MVETAVTVLAAGAVVVYGWWATSLQHFTWPSRAVILVPGLVLLGIAAKRSRLCRRHRTQRADRAGLTIWAVLGLAIVGWELFNFFHSGRSEYPTLSSLVNGLDSTSHPVRLVMFLGWVALGWDLAERR